MEGYSVVKLICGKVSLVLKSTSGSGTELTVSIHLEKKNIIMEMSKRKKKTHKKNNIIMEMSKQQQKEERKTIIMEMSPNTNMSRLSASLLTVLLFLCLFD